MALLKKNPQQVLVDTENLLSNNYNSLEDQKKAFNEYVKNILKFNNSLYNKIKILKGSPTVTEPYNTFFENTYKRLQAINTRYEALLDKFGNGIRGLEAESNLINQDIKVVRSLLNILSLYNKINDDNLFYFSDTFSNLDKINFDSNNGLITTAYVDTEAGVVTLPRNNVEYLIDTNTQYNILPESTSLADFNPEKPLVNAFDNFTDNWAEYFLDSSTNTLTLKLKFLLTLKDEFPVNQIKIEPTNFGTSNWLKINSISTSRDNITFTPIQQIDFQFLNAGVKSSLEPELLLSTYEQKFTRVGSFIFEPIRAKYILFDLEQREPIKLDSDTYRYLIGIRNIEVNSISYNTRGVLYTQEFIRDSVNKEIGSVTLSATANIDSSNQLGKMKFYISNNNDSWYTIAPKEEAIGNEVRVFNQPWLQDNIDTGNIVDKLFFKIEFENNIAEITDIAEKILVTKEYSQIIPLSLAYPYTTTLDFSPKANSLQILAMPFGSVGQNEKILIKSSLDNTQSHVIETPFELTSEDTIYIGDTELYRSNSPGVFTIEASNGTNQGNYTVFSSEVQTTTTTNLPATLKKFSTLFIYLKPNIDEFGDPEYWWEGKDILLVQTSSPVRASKATDSEVTNYPRLKNKNIVRLKHYCDGIKEHIKVFKVYQELQLDGSYDRQYVEFSYILPKNSLRFKIDANLVKPFDSTDTNSGLKMIDAFEIPYIDGITELMSTENHVFSVNYYTGEVYRKYPNTEQISVRCLKEVKTELQNNQWELMPLNDGIVLVDSAYDANAWYEVLYQIAIPIDTSYFSVTNNIVSLNDYGKVNNYISNINTEDRLIKFTYLYEEKTEDPISELTNYFSPILKDYTLTCTGLQF